MPFSARKLFIRNKKSASYVYRRLDESKSEIRLITLRSAPSFSDPIKIHLEHVPFHNPQDSSSDTYAPSPSIADVVEALPQGWNADQTMQGRFVFYADASQATWTHPNPNFKDADLLASWHPPIQQPRIPHFEALSYCWGEDTANEKIEVLPTAGDTTSLSTKLQVRKTLCTALRHLRFPDSARVLWIDALCLNQRDLVERAEQVPRMTSIYTHAARTVAWLGPAGSDGAHAIKDLNWIANQCILTQNGNYFGRPDASDPRTWESSYEIPWKDSQWHAIRSLLTRPYFSRLWIVQEVALSKKSLVILCGHEAISAEDLYTACMVLLYKEKEQVPNLRNSLFAANKLFTDVSNAEFLTLLGDQNARNCTEPRDKIYGLLGLASPRVRAAIKIDYTSPVFECYRNAVLAIGNAYQRLDFLQFCALEADDMERASWVPDLSLNNFTMSYLSLSSGFSAACFTVAGNALCVEGVKCCTVSNVVPINALDPMTSLKDLFSSRWKHTGGLKYPTGGTMEEAVLVSLVGGFVAERLDEQWADAFLGISKLRSLFRSDGDDSDHETMAQTLHSHLVLPALRQSCIIQCDNGYVGVGADICKLGDVVCSFLGMNSLALLRRCGRDRYRLVGSCYVHGFMDGEAFLGPLPEHWKLLFDDRSDDGITVDFKHSRDSGQGAERQADPRLPDISAEWEWLRISRTRDDPRPSERYREKATGRTINYHPLMIPEALKARGVPLETFVLV